jgi:hypothetical protein
MKMHTWRIAALAGLMALATAGAGWADSSFGAGARYFRTLDELDGEFEEDGLAPLVTVRTSLASLLQLQLDVVLYPDGYAGSAGKDVLSPQAFLLLGRGLYAGLGVGTLYADSDFGDAFFIARAGVDLELLPGLHVDVNANYEFAEWEKINTLDEDVDSDTVTLGAALRLDL